MAAEFGHGNLLKTLTSNQHYDLWSRDTRSLPANSPTRVSRDETLEEFNASNYKSSIFPSLFRKSEAEKFGSVKQEDGPTELIQSKPTRVRSRRKSRTSFFEDMQRRNESHYLRIQAVAKEQMAIYEKNAKEMEDKIRRQREEIQKKAQSFLEKLADQEAKRKEEKIYSSSYGRIWRHHRVMQRRALNLEPMTPQNTKLSDTGIT